MMHARPCTSHPQTARLAALVIVSLSFTASAVAAEFCVTCTSPSAQYRCAISNDGVLTTPPGAQLSCIQELARQGGHKQCAVMRDTSETCAGKLLVLSPNPDLEIPPNHPIIHSDKNQTPDAWAPTDSDPALATVQSDKDTGTDEDTPAPSTTPKTVVDLVGQTVESSQENLATAGRVVVDTANQTGGHIQNAGQYVGNTAKTTWDCLTSFFFDCGAKPGETPQPQPVPQADAPDAPPATQPAP